MRRLWGALGGAVFALVPLMLSAGELKVPLRDNEMVLWSRPAQVDFWVPAEVVILQNPMTQILADTNGMVLYAFHCDENLAAEAPPEAQFEGAGFTRAQTCAHALKHMNHTVKDGQPRCVDGCAREHPPLLAPRTAVAQGDWSIVERNDGTRQWAYKGHPLYRFVADEIQGYPAGSQTGGVWEYMRVDGRFPAAFGFRRERNQAPAPPTITAAPGVKVQTTTKGSVLADYRGMTLYASSTMSDSSGDSQIDPPRWKPLPAPALASPVGEWTVVARGSGVRQWAYKGKPLYTCDGDLKPGDINCSGQNWSAVAWSH